jgi:tetratricopeptide (TPR) repeat protein
MSSSHPDTQTILFLAVNPKDTGRLRLDQELRDIAEGLQRAQKRDQFNLEQRLAVRPRDIQRVMLDVGPQIIHFSGHGEGEQGLVFEDEIGNAKRVDGAALAGLFELFADQVTCVVLNGCYSEVQAKAIAQHIPYVIGMNQAIGDKAAIAFAVGFYDALGAGRPIEFAYKLGCAAIRLEGIAENLTPVLLKQSTPGDVTIQPTPAVSFPSSSPALSTPFAYEAYSEVKTTIAKEKQALSLAQATVNRCENIRLSGVSETDFFGREEELEKLRQLFHLHGQLMLVAVVGMGGVGKTELAIQYARQHFEGLGNKSGGVCWVDAKEGDVGLQLIRFAETFLGLKFQEGWNLKTQLQFCWQKWPKGDWLITIDDVTDYRQEVRPYIPTESSAFQVLLTTRESIGRPIKDLPMQELQSNDAQALLQSLIGQERIEREQAATHELCKWLGCLPLGIELVGRYLERDPDLSLIDMLSRLQKKGLEHRSLLNVGQSAMTAERGVAAAFEVSWERLNETAHQLGCLLSLFALADVPWDLVKLVYTHLASIQESSATDESILENAKTDLIYLNLLKRVGEGTHRVEKISEEKGISSIRFSLKSEGIYRLHPLIYQFFKEKQESTLFSKDLKKAFATSLTAVIKHVPQRLSVSHIVAFFPAIPHAVKAVSNQELTSFLSYEDLSAVYAGLSNFYDGLGLVSRAEFWAQKDLFLTQELFGNNCYAVAEKLDRLAKIYLVQGRYKETESTSMNAIEVVESLPESQNSENKRIKKRIVGLLCNLALAYYHQRHSDEARRIQVKALDLGQLVFEENDPSLASIFNNMGLIYQQLALYSEAEDFYLKALKIRQDVLDKGDPELASSLNNLAGLYADLKRFDEAESYYLSSLELCKIFLPKNHRYIAETQSSLGSMYISQKRFAEAEPLLVQALEAHTELFGEDHPDVAISMSNLATLYFKRGQLLRAKTLFIKALEIYRNRLGVKSETAIEHQKILKIIDISIEKKLVGSKRRKNNKSNKGFGEISRD